MPLGGLCLCVSRNRRPVWLRQERARESEISAETGTRSGPCRPGPHNAPARRPQDLGDDPPLAGQMRKRGGQVDGHWNRPWFLRSFSNPAPASEDSCLGPVQGCASTLSRRPGKTSQVATTAGQETGMLQHCPPGAPAQRAASPFIPGNSPRGSSGLPAPGLPDPSSGPRGGSFPPRLVSLCLN